MSTYHKTTAFPDWMYWKPTTSLDYNYTWFSQNFKEINDSLRSSPCHFRKSEIYSNVYGKKTI